MDDYWWSKGNTYSFLGNTTSRHDYVRFFFGLSVMIIGDVIVYIECVNTNTPTACCGMLWWLITLNLIFGSIILAQIKTLHCLPHTLLHPTSASQKPAQLAPVGRILSQKFLTIIRDITVTISLWTRRWLCSLSYYIINRIQWCFKLKKQLIGQFWEIEFQETNLAILIRRSTGQHLPLPKTALAKLRGYCNRVFPRPCNSVQKVDVKYWPIRSVMCSTSKSHCRCLHPLFELVLQGLGKTQVGEVWFGRCDPWKKLYRVLGNTLWLLRRNLTHIQRFAGRLRD